jgi:hypothetical protein
VKYPYKRAKVTEGAVSTGGGCKEAAAVAFLMIGCEKKEVVREHLF